MEKGWTAHEFKHYENRNRWKFEDKINDSPTGFKPPKKLSFLYRR